MDRRLTWYILGGMILGVIVGQILYSMVDPAVVKESIAPWFKLLSDIFLNLIKLLVAPLVLSTIVVGAIVFASAHTTQPLAEGAAPRLAAQAVMALMVAAGIGLSRTRSPAAAETRPAV